MAMETSRRDFFKAAGLLGIAAAAPQAQHPPAPPPAPRQFFTDPQARLVAAMVDRLIPADDWPSASAAGVVDYLDRQLSGAYGAGARMYLRGPFAQGTAQQGYQLPLTPAELYRAGLAGMDAAVPRKYGKGFAELAAADQDKALAALEKGELELPGVPGPVFFATLLANTIEGYFCDPAHGGNKDMAGWRMVGFPGAYAQYAYDVEKHGQRYTRAPMGMAEGGAPWRHG
jgi:gluconate 2-dehydrogenase gamma chain